MGIVVVSNVGILIELENVLVKKVDEVGVILYLIIFVIGNNKLYGMVVIYC